MSSQQSHHEVRRDAQGCGPELEGIGRAEKGERLFGDDSEPRAFKLSHSAVSPNGIIVATYVRAGAVATTTVSGARRSPTAIKKAPE